MNTLNQRTVFITGASRGIGKAIAKTFLDEGARVAICARNETVLAATAEELGGSGEVHHRRTDVAEADAAAEFVDWAADRLGGLDVVVSNVSAHAGSDFTASCQVDIVGARVVLLGVQPAHQQQFVDQFIEFGNILAHRIAPLCVEIALQHVEPEPDARQRRAQFM